MTPPQLQLVKEAFAIMGHYYRQALRDEVVAMYAQDVADLDYEHVIRALAQLRREPGRRQCPLPADVRNIVQPRAMTMLAQANEVAGRIVGAVPRYGYTNADRAEKFIGPVGWEVVRMQGGWAHICNTLTVDHTRTFYAQTRDLALSVLERGAAPKEQRPALGPAKGKGGMMSLGDVLAQVSGKVQAPSTERSDHARREDHPDADAHAEQRRAPGAPRR